jgi:hypothetical protein
MVARTGTMILAECRHQEEFCRPSGSHMWQWMIFLHISMHYCILYIYIVKQSLDIWYMYMYHTFQITCVCVCFCFLLHVFCLYTCVSPCLMFMFISSVWFPCVWAPIFMQSLDTCFLTLFMNSFQWPCMCVPKDERYRGPSPLFALMTHQGPLPPGFAIIHAFNTRKHPWLGIIPKGFKPQKWKFHLDVIWWEYSGERERESLRERERKRKRKRERERYIYIYYT